ncbi:MAG: lipase maturation factor family protein [Myxococcota bacterium]
MAFETTYYLTGLLLKRSLGLVYLLAFIAVIHQYLPLLGKNGLLPIDRYIKRSNFKERPSLFFLMPQDSAILIFGWLGVALSLMVLFGLPERFGIWVSFSVWVLLWLLYLSFVNVGQIFYSFGWESMLLEAGFLAIFLDGGNVTIWLYRWFLFRVMFGAGMIKIRGDKCWRDLTCLYYHYESQPIPNPLSWYFHHLPKPVHRFGVLVNHLVELAVPFLYFMPQPIAGIAGAATILFHGWLFMSGNFAFLGFLTMILCISTFSDAQLIWLFGDSWGMLHHSEVLSTLTYGVAALVAALSIKPIRNMFSRRQIMNASFDPFHLVGTYGAFGSITRPRYELIIEGSWDGVHWQAYEFWGKPGDLKRAGIQIAPYHLRLDWLMWFAAMSSPYQHPWLFNLIGKLMHNDRALLRLFRTNPFKNRPPVQIRVQRYVYRFTTPAERASSGNYWHREFIEDFLLTSPTIPGGVQA